MNALHTILTIIQVILAVGLVVIVTIQSGKSAGLSGAIAGGSGDTYLGKNKNKGLDAKLALATKWYRKLHFHNPFIIMCPKAPIHMLILNVKCKGNKKADIRCYNK